VSDEHDDVVGLVTADDLKRALTLSSIPAP
jgi:hypothetical protein